MRFTAGTDHSIKTFKCGATRLGRVAIQEGARVMVSPMKEVSSAARAVQDTAETTIAELRDSVSALAKEVATIAERRTRAARETAVETAEAGAAELRRTIRRQPAISMAVAAAAGAVLALLVVPRFGRSTAP